MLFQRSAYLSSAFGNGMLRHSFVALGEGGGGGIVIRYKVYYWAAPKSWSKYTTFTLRAASKSWSKYL